MAEMLAVRGQLDPEGGAALTTALDALTSPPMDGDERSSAQRRADALVELARRHLVAGDLPTVGGQRPQVGVLLYPQALSPKTLAKLAEVHREDAAGRRFQQLLTDSGTTDWTRPGVRGDGSDVPTRMAGRTREDVLADLLQPGQPDMDESSARIGVTDADSTVWESAQMETVPSRMTGGAMPTVLRPTWSRSGWADPPWLDWIGPIPPAVAQRIACDADIWRVILDPTSGMPLDVGRAHRLVPYWIRRALHTRDRGCRWPSCTTPAQWSDAHHIRPWAEHGETKVDDCVLLCRYHHGLVHEGSWRIDLDPDTSEVHITRPEGIPYLVPRTHSVSWKRAATPSRGTSATGSGACASQ